MLYRHSDSTLTVVMAVDGKTDMVNIEGVRDRPVESNYESQLPKFDSKPPLFSHDQNIIGFQRGQVCKSCLTASVLVLYLVSE